MPRGRGEDRSRIIGGRILGEDCSHPRFDKWEGEPAVSLTLSQSHIHMSKNVYLDLKLKLVTEFCNGGILEKNSPTSFTCSNA